MAIWAPRGSPQLGRIGRSASQGWKSNERVILTRNGDYWGEPSKMKRIIMRHIPELQSQRLMLEKGDIDIASRSRRRDLKALAPIRT